MTVKTTISVKFFTLIELIAVIVVLGILSVTALVEFDQGLIDTSEMNAAYDLLRSDIRFVQTRSLVNDTTNVYSLQISSNGYQILVNGGATTETFPADTDAQRLYNNVTFSPASTIVFDNLGQTTQQYAIGLSNGGSSATLTLNANGRIVE